MRALLLALAWLSFANAADEIFLQSGKDIEGEIVEIGPVKTTIRNTRGITSTVPTSNIVAFKVNGRLVSGAPNPDSLVSYRQPAPGDSARPSQPAAPGPRKGRGRGRYRHCRIDQALPDAQARDIYCHP